MTKFRQTTDGADTYHATSAADLARKNASPQMGNLADLSKNATIIWDHAITVYPEKIRARKITPTKLKIAK